MNRVYLKCKDGVLRTWKLNILTALILKVKAGWLTVRGGRYRIDPSKFERRGYRPLFPWFGLVERYEWVLFYHEGETEPFTLDKPAETGNVSAADLHAVTEATYLRSLLPAPFPWVIILIVVGVVVVMGIVGAFV